jgi:hypothetical protein
VNIRAGQLQVIDLVVQHIALLSGVVEITRDAVVERPTGPVSATDENGRIFETVAAAGDFRMYLPPGRYAIRYNGEISAALTSQLVATVAIGESGDPVAVRLVAIEKARGLRQTLFMEAEGTAKPPLLP